MKLLLKILIAIVILIALLALGAVITVKSFAPSMAASYLKNKTGFEMKWSKFDIQPLGGNLIVEDFELNNSSAFETPLMVSMPELRVDADLGSFRTPPYRINDITVHIAQVNMVKDKDGVVNFQAMQEKLAPASASAQEKEPTTTPKEAVQEAPEITFGYIKVQVDSFAMIDHSVTPAKKTVIPLNFVLERNEITLPQLQKDVVSSVMPVVLRQLGPVMAQEALGSALGLSNKAAAAASESLKDASKAASSSLKAGTDAASSTFDAAADSAKEATKSLKNAASSIKSLFGK